MLSKLVSIDVLVYAWGHSVSKASLSNSFFAFLRKTDLKIMPSYPASPICAQSWQQTQNSLAQCLLHLAQLWIMWWEQEQEAGTLVSWVTWLCRPHNRVCFAHHFPSAPNFPPQGMAVRMRDRRAHWASFS